MKRARLIQHAARREHRRLRQLRDPKDTPVHRRDGARPQRAPSQPIRRVRWIHRGSPRAGPSRGLHPVPRRPPKQPELIRDPIDARQVGGGPEKFGRLGQRPPPLACGPEGGVAPGDALENRPLRRDREVGRSPPSRRAHENRRVGLVHRVQGGAVPEGAAEPADEARVPRAVRADNCRDEVVRGVLRGAAPINPGAAAEPRHSQRRPSGTPPTRPGASG